MVGEGYFTFNDCLTPIIVAIITYEKLFVKRFLKYFLENFIFLSAAETSDDRRCYFVEDKGLGVVCKAIHAVIVLGGCFVVIAC